MCDHRRKTVLWGSRTPGPPVTGREREPGPPAGGDLIPGCDDACHGCLRSGGDPSEKNYDIIITKNPSQEQPHEPR